MVKINFQKSEHYYGSDLNKFIDQFCTRRMTCNNIDCLLVKISQKRIRFIESKHNNENIPKSQFTALKILNSIFQTAKTPWQIEFYIARGDYPFENGIEIQDLNSQQTFQLTQQELIRWLNFELELEQTQVPITSVSHSLYLHEILEVDKS